MPAGAVQVRPDAVNVGPVTWVIIGRQVASSNGSVAVTQSTIFRSPVVVFCSAGCSRSTPESMMPMVTPRPSHFGFCLTNLTAPVSFVGMYGLSAGVLASGPLSVVPCLSAFLPP